MPVNNLFPRGTKQEHSLYEDLIVESIRSYGNEFYYIPRTLIDVDEILGEDRLSMFKNSYQIECYVDDVDGYGGQGAFMSKFGISIEESATITVARRRWEQLVGRYGQTIIPSRPCEGDLLYFPTTDSIFEIRSVEHQNPFYQMGRLFVYKMKVELFQFSSERFETGIDEVDNYALAASFDLMQTGIQNDTGGLMLDEQGNEIIQQGIDKKKEQDFDRSNEINQEAEKILDVIEKNPFADFD